MPLCGVQLAVIQIQRVWRGHLGRERAKRRRAWLQAAPGPDRLQLGLKVIQGSKEAFERQKQEIDQLHRAYVRDAKQGAGCWLLPVWAIALLR